MCFQRQRVEDQIKEVQDNSEGKKFEVCLPLRSRAGDITARKLTSRQIYQLQSQLSSEEGAAA